MRLLTRFSCRWLALCVGAALPLGVATAHIAESESSPTSTWQFDPEIVLPLAIAALLYTLGAARLWRGAGVGRGLRRTEGAAFASGWLVLFAALCTPLDTLGSELFSAHMVQHEALMLLAAPLLVLGRPLISMLWALPLPWRRKAGRWGQSDAIRIPWRLLTRPSAAWALHAVVLWFWHIPSLFTAALVAEWIHVLQHLTFLVSALLFWWSLMQGREGTMGYGAATLYMFTTAVHTSILGALLTFAPSVWYPLYAETAPGWGLTALEDQQLGGLIMWVPGGLVYALAGLAFIAKWLQESERRVVQRESRATRGQ